MKVKTASGQTYNEAELVRSAQRGDTNAFGDLYEIHLDAIYRYIYYRVSGVKEAEDLTETVFLKAWEALDGYEYGSVPFVAWLYRIAHNIVIDHYRSRKEEVPLETRFHLPDGKQGPEEQLGRKEEIKSLMVALQELKPVYQQVITLRFIQGLSHAETGDIVDRSEGAVRVIQYRALKALREIMEEVQGRE